MEIFLNFCSSPKFKRRMKPDKVSHANEKNPRSRRLHSALTTPVWQKPTWEGTMQMWSVTISLPTISFPLPHHQLLFLSPFISTSHTFQVTREAIVLSVLADNEHWWETFLWVLAGSGKLPIRPARHTNAGRATHLCFLLILSSPRCKFQSNHETTCKKSSRAHLEITGPCTTGIKRRLKSTDFSWKKKEEKVQHSKVEPTIFVCACNPDELDYILTTILDFNLYPKICWCHNAVELRLWVPANLHRFHDQYK